jgi:phosphoribosyl-dephospho-CoA transferase
VNSSRFQRHDLIWLDPKMDAGLFAAANQADIARSWVTQGFPLVVARQSAALAAGSNQIVLGFTLPSAPMRTRVTLYADRAAIVRHSRPLLLIDTIQHAPENWQAGLKKLHALFEKNCTVARVYGSLSSEVITGKPYIDAASDLDLLLEYGDADKLPELLAELENCSLSEPRIDGEILSASGWAVAWHELASALRTGAPRQVLAKSNCEVRLIPIDEFIQPLLIPA